MGQKFKKMNDIDQNLVIHHKTNLKNNPALKIKQSNKQVKILDTHVSRKLFHYIQVGICRWNARKSVHMFLRSDMGGGRKDDDVYCLDCRTKNYAFNP